MAASRLAPRLGLETAPFKSNVRKLKALGLTTSHDTGYTLTFLGARVLREGASLKEHERESMQMVDALFGNPDAHGCHDQSRRDARIAYGWRRSFLDGVLNKYGWRRSRREAGGCRAG